MAKCEWLGVDCPDELYKTCRVRPRVERLLDRQAGTTNKGTFGQIDARIGELADQRCPLEEELFPKLGLLDLTPEQLALVGAKRLPYLCAPSR